MDSLLCGSPEFQPTPVMLLFFPEYRRLNGCGEDESIAHFASPVPRDSLPVTAT